VQRFTARFGDRVSVMNSTLSAGEKQDQCRRAERGELDVIIGPRSALFVPFPNLGMILMDEEHELSYKSETSPKYHARETAQKLAELSDATLVLGSATPSLEAYSRAQRGDYHFFGEPAGKIKGSSGEERAVDAVFEPARLCRICLVPCLRLCMQMSALRRFPFGAQGRKAGLPLLRV